MTIEVLGYMAGGICSVALFPQIYKSARTRATAHLSYGMLFFNFSGVLMYLVYGLFIAKPAIWVSMCVSGTSTLVLIAQKTYYETHAGAPAPAVAPIALQQISLSEV